SVLQRKKRSTLYVPEKGYFLNDGSRSRISQNHMHSLHRSSKDDWPIDAVYLSLAVLEYPICLFHRLSSAPRCCSETRLSPFHNSQLADPSWCNKIFAPFFRVTHSRPALSSVVKQ